MVPARSERHSESDLRPDAREADEVSVLVRGLALPVVDVADAEKQLEGAEIRRARVDEPPMCLYLGLRKVHGTALTTQRVHVVDPVGQQQSLARESIAKSPPRLEAERRDG